MTILDDIIREHCMESKNHANAIGEILRAWAFPGKGYGCYSTFEIRAEFEKVDATDREFEFLWGRKYEPFSDDVDELKYIHWHKHPSGIEMGWHWDGDGMLAFYVPELVDKYYNGVVYNDDCKKDYNWEFGEKHV